MPVIFFTYIKPYKMKKIFFGTLLLALTAITLTACNSNPGKKDAVVVNNAEIKEANVSAKTDTKVDGAIHEMLNQYLQIKNALADDNGKVAASAGNAFVESMGKMETNSLTPEKKKVWEDLSDDAKEMAEHIGKNADKLAHQREHFDMLSKDMYDMVKTFGADQALYNDYCPMYNNNKGATWLSEAKEIKNPYLGKKMPTCGSVKEEIK